MKGSRIISELMRRKVVRVGVGYTVVIWLLLQIAEVTFEPLHLPDWAMTLLVVLAIVGFPLAIVLAWAFEVTPEGLIRDPQDTNDSVVAGTQAVKKKTYNSVAVLPFADMSPDRDQEYFCEGIAEEILGSVSTVKCLQVPSRTSSFRFDADESDIQAVGKALNVETVLEGSVRKDGDQLRITAQLIDVQNGFHIWAKCYDRQLNDVFEVQKELACDIVRQLCESLNPEGAFLREPTTVNDIRSYDYYLKGRHFLNRFTRQYVEFSEKMFSKAADLDPKFSLAWAGLAEAHTYLYFYFDGSQEHRDTACAAAKKAVTLAPDSAPCVTARGMSLMTAGHYVDADRQFEGALAVNPMQFSATYYYASSCQLQGKLEQAAALFERASQRRPEDFQAPLLALTIYRSLHRPDKAREAARRGTKAAELHLLLHPDDVRALYLGSLGYLELCDVKQATIWIERALALNPTDDLTCYNAACYYAQAGNLNRAFVNLSKVNRSGKFFGDWMDNDPDLNVLRDDPRFSALRQTVQTVAAVSK